MANIERIVLATSNPGKIKEFQFLLDRFHLQVVPQSDFKLEDAEETGLTFIENALIKARHAAALTGLPALADDSGLAVDALDGAPGIYSARYAGRNLPSSDHIKKLLTNLKDVSEAERTATFHCVLAFMTHAEDPVPLICHGTLSGIILDAPRGEHGFGYDPVFFVPSHQKAAAELPPEIKNKISHRAVALQQLLQQLPEKL